MENDAAKRAISIGSPHTAEIGEVLEIGFGPQIFLSFYKYQWLPTPVFFEDLPERGGGNHTREVGFRQVEININVYVNVNLCYAWACRFGDSWESPAVQAIVKQRHTVLVRPGARYDGERRHA